jgi:predicted  nucleic acid-binding Zn-ribbon protein
MNGSFQEAVELIKMIQEEVNDCNTDMTEINDRLCLVENSALKLIADLELLNEKIKSMEKKLMFESPRKILLSRCVSRFSSLNQIDLKNL